MAALAAMMADDIEWVNPGDPGRRPERRNVQRQGRRPGLVWWSGHNCRVHDVRAARVHRPERQGGVSGVCRGNHSGHGPGFCQSRGTRMDVPGWEGRPTTDLSRHRSDGCRPSRGVAPRGDQRIAAAGGVRTPDASALTAVHPAQVHDAPTDGSGSARWPVGTCPRVRLVPDHMRSKSPPRWPTSRLTRRYSTSTTTWHALAER